MSKRRIDQVLEQLDSRTLGRRDILKLIGVSGAAVAAAPLLAACGGGKTAGEPTAVITAAKSAPLANLVLIANDWNTTMATAASNTSKLLNLPYAELAFDADESKALGLAEQQIAAGTKMLFMQGADGASIPNISGKAQAAGTYFANMWTTSPWHSPFDTGDHYVWFVTASDDINMYESVKSMLTQLQEKKGDEAKLLHITGLDGSSLDSQRTLAVNRAVAEFPGMKIVGSLPGKWVPEGGQKAAEDLVSRYGRPDGIIVQNDGALTGVLAALNALGMKPGEDVLLCGVDGANDIVQAIAAGRVAATGFTSPHYFGVAQVVRLFDAFNGVKFTAPERQMGVVGATVTKENAAAISKRYIDIDDNTLPYDPRKMSRHLSPEDWDPMIGLTPIDMEEYWKSTGIAKPSGFTIPQEYQESRDSGEWDEIKALYESHYKIKLDDSFDGISV